MDIVDKVAADIAEIPGNPSAREIARVAIEAYQRELWTPAFDQQILQPELRRRERSVWWPISCPLSVSIFATMANAAAPVMSPAIYSRLYTKPARKVVTDADRAIATITAARPIRIDGPGSGLAGAAGVWRSCARR